MLRAIYLCTNCTKTALVLFPTPKHTKFNFSHFFSLSDCTEDLVNCLKCGPSGCVKCPQLIEIDTRRCVEECARGYSSQWSTTNDFMGRVCRPSAMGPHHFFLTIVLVTTVALLGCAIVLSVVFCLRKRRRKKTIRDKLIDDSVTRAEFLRQLEDLRPNAEYFLGMLNDTRRQIRKLHANGDVTGTQAYRPIVRDLAKILLLVNKPVQLLAGPPNDWLRLFMWAQRILERYKPQMSPLIDFLQSDQNLTLADSRLAACQHHTFKSNTTNSTTTSDSPEMQPRHSYGCLISLQDFDMRSSATLPARSDQLMTVTSAGGGGGFKMLGNNSSNRHSVSDVHNSALWLEEEFFNLGLRPQDEITTEL